MKLFSFTWIFSFTNSFPYFQDFIFLRLWICPASSGWSRVSRKTTLKVLISTLKCGEAWAILMKSRQRRAPKPCSLRMEGCGRTRFWSNFTEVLEELKKQIKVPKTDHRPQLTEDEDTASIASKKYRFLQSSSNVVKGTIVSVCLNLRKVDNTF